LIFSERYPLGCICKWISYLNITGWVLSETHPCCRFHGKKRNERKENPSAPLPRESLRRMRGLFPAKELPPPPVPVVADDAPEEVAHVKYWKTILGMGTAVVAIMALALAVTGQRSSASSPQLVYICSFQPCANAQELEVFDANGAPIWSAGEFGGDAVFGDNRSVYPPGSVTNPSVVESYTTPAGYGKTSCVAPEVWVSPTGIYACHGGKFALEMRL
jgi:hypothetical protein